MCDECGNLYDTVGNFDFSLWTGTDALIAKLEGEISRKESPEVKKGAKVRHVFFGDGEILETDNDGVVTVNFKRFGKRKVTASSLQKIKGS